MTLECPKCGSFIFSRDRHDYRTCPCGEVSIDGGFDYFRVAFKDVMPRTVRKLVPATRKELFDDWNLRTNKFGIIAPKHENKKRICK